MTLEDKLKAGIWYDDLLWEVLHVIRPDADNPGHAYVIAGLKDQDDNTDIISIDLGNNVCYPNTRAVRALVKARKSAKAEILQIDSDLSDYWMELDGKAW